MWDKMVVKEKNKREKEKMGIKKTYKLRINENYDWIQKQLDKQIFLIARLENT